MKKKINIIVKIRDIQRFLEGFNAWHSTDKDFDKFEDGHKGIGSVYGEGLYFELTGADENYAEYVGKDNFNNRHQIKAWIDADLDKEILDADKTLKDQNLSLSFKDLKYLYDSELLMHDIKSRIDFRYNVSTYDEMMEKIGKLAVDVNALTVMLKIDMRTIFNEEISTLIKDIIYSSWMRSGISEKFAKKSKKEFFSKYENKEIYNIFEEMKEKYYKMIMYYCNSRCLLKNLIRPIFRKNYSTIHKLWPHIKGVKYEATSAYGTDKEVKAIGGDSRGHLFKRIYLILWNSKYAHITSKRKKITQKFDDEIDDEILQQQLDYAQ